MPSLFSDFIDSVDEVWNLVLYSLTRFLLSEKEIEIYINSSSSNRSEPKEADHCGKNNMRVKTDRLRDRMRLIE